jgi:hypothetical protein
MSRAAGLASARPAQKKIEAKAMPAASFGVERMKRRYLICQVRLTKARASAKLCT